MKPRKRRYKKAVHAVMNSCGYGYEQAAELLRQLDEALAQGAAGTLVPVADNFWDEIGEPFTPEELEAYATQTALSEHFDGLPRSVRVRLNKHGLTGNVTFLIKKYERRFKNNN